MHLTSHTRSILGKSLIAATTALLCATGAYASSHREAPFIATMPKVDGTDFYMFNSYEGVSNTGTGGRAGFTTLIANYQPLQDAYGGPNYFKLDPNALYEIHIDSNGDAKEDLTFQFRFKNTLKNFKGVDSFSAGQSIPLTANGMVTTVADSHLNVVETYDLTLVRGDRRTGTRTFLGTFTKPVDYIGTKTNGTPDQYEAYAQLHIGTFTIPGCSQPSKVFVGQRQEGFAVNLGTIFDLVNAPLSTLTAPRGSVPDQNVIGDKNVTSLALEVASQCLTGAGNGVIGGWTTASLPQAAVLSASPKSGHQTTQAGGGAWVQVSRLGSPLVNEVVIGLKDKDRFNGSVPSNDGQFANYVTKPTLPALISFVLTQGTTAAPAFVRNDLVAAFLTGIPGVNQLATVTGSEMLRLNTGIKPVPYAAQSPLGLVGGVLAAGTVGNALAAQSSTTMISDLAGFPNGRRPKDDVVDIALVATMGGLCTDVLINAGVAFGGDCKNANVPLAGPSFTDSNGVPAVLKLSDQANQENATFLTRFPYLNTPNGGTK